MSTKEFHVELVARIICHDRGYDPDMLEPGDVPQIDGTCSDGSNGHYFWREFTELAEKIITAIPNL
jgi:hypothetical protein